MDDLTCEPATARGMGSYPSGQRGLTVNQLANAFGGSNPSLPTGRLTENPQTLGEFLENGKPS